MRHQAANLLPELQRTQRHPGSVLLLSSLGVTSTRAGDSMDQRVAALPKDLTQS